jgi:hypothetical protein
LTAQASTALEAVSIFPALRAFDAATIAEICVALGTVPKV